MPISEVTSQRRRSNSVDRQKQDHPLDTDFEWVYPYREASKIHWSSEGHERKDAVMTLRAQ